MSRIYDALKKLEAERAGRKGANGSGNGHGNGHGKGRSRVWEWLFSRERTSRPEELALNFELGPDVEEAYQQLGTSLLIAPGAESERVPALVGMVAARHGEGTTTTAAVFASIVARRRSGRACVVEANLRSPAFERVFGTHAGGGFADVIRGERCIADVTQATSVPNLYAIGAGQAPHGVSALFDAAGVAGALAQLRESFDFVVFDLPPVNVYGDSTILGPRLDAAIIVIEADNTRIPEVERARRALDRVGVRVAGCVLNRRRSYIPGFIEELL